jgi:hypothetical protein
MESDHENDSVSSDEFSEDPEPEIVVPAANSSKINNPPPPPKPAPVPVQYPTNSEIQQKVAESIVDRVNERADIAVAKAKPPTVTQTKQMANVISAQEDTLKERTRLARLLNEKKKTYTGRIEYKFRPNYDPTKMTLEQLKVENEECDIIINSQGQFISTVF